MNYKEADLPDDTYKMLRKKYGEYHKDGRPNSPGIKDNDQKKITPILSTKKMKTFKQFQEESVYSTKQFTKFGRSNYPKNTPFIIDDFIKNRAKELFKFKTGIPLAKKKSNNNIKTS